MKRIISKILENNFSWLTAQQLVSFLINYIIVIFQARVLSPESYGIVVLLNLFVIFSSLFAGLGIEKMIIRNQIKNNITLSALLNGVLIFSGIIFIITIITFPLFLKFYFGSYMINYSLAVLSAFGIFPSSLLVFAYAIYVRDKSFVKSSKIMIFSLVSVFVIVIVMTLLIPKTESLIYKQILVSLVPATILLYKSDFKYKIVFSKVVFLRLVSFSKFLTFNGVFNFFVRNIDYVIIGKFFNQSILGQYGIAYKILVTPVKLITSQIDTVSFPNYTKLLKNLPELKKYYLSNVRLISQTLFPVIISIILFSNLIVDLFFDSRYGQLALIISLLSVSALFQSVTATVGNVYIIFNQTRKMLFVSIFAFLMLGSILFAIAHTKSIYYFTAGYSMAYILTNFPVSNYFALKPLKISIFEMLRHMATPFFVSLIILGSFFLLDYLLGINIYIKIVILLVLIITVYLLIHDKLKSLIGLKNVWHSRNI